MKRTALALMLIFALLFSGAELVEIANANFNPFPPRIIDPVPGTIPPSISINNPQNHTSYPSNNITVNFSVRTAELEGWSSYINYVEWFLDKGIHNQLVPVNLGEYAGEFFDTEFNMSLLPSGNHSLTVRASAVVYLQMDEFFLDTNSTVFFTLDNRPPVISDLFVENKTYNEFDLPLNFTVNEPTSWVGYSLDNEANVTLSGNSTLTLNEGVHSIVVYANDTFGHIGASETIYFTIEEPFPKTLVIASSVTLAAIVVGIGLLLYLIKRK